MPPIKSISGRLDLSRVSESGISPEMRDVLSIDLEKLKKSQETKSWLDRINQDRMQKMGETTGVGDIINVLGAAKAPAATILDEGMAAADKYSRIDGGQTDVSMIPTKANLSRFLANMRKTAVQSMKDFPEAGVAEAYLHARYPKRSAELFPLTVREPKFLEMNVAGSFNPESQATTLMSVAQKGSPNIHKIPQMIDTLAHEGQHAIDFRRPASPVSKDDFISPSRGGSYISPKLDGSNLAEYKNQPVEARAFKAGETARNSYDKFIALLPEPKNIEVRKPFSGIPQTVEQKFSNIASGYNRAIKSAYNIFPPEQAEAYAKGLKENKKQSMDLMSKQANFRIKFGIGFNTEYSPPARNQIYTTSNSIPITDWSKINNRTLVSDYSTRKPKTKLESLIDEMKKANGITRLPE